MMHLIEDKAIIGSFQIKICTSFLIQYSELEDEATRSKIHLALAGLINDDSRRAAINIQVGNKI